MERAPEPVAPADSIGSRPRTGALAPRSRWRTSSPFREFVIKVHSRCDLACDHCYVYTKADQSWRDRPRRMPMPVLELAAERIAEHAKRHELRRCRVVLHGGEPLLAGPRYLREAIRVLRAAMDESTGLDLSIQTNGVRLDQEFLRLFAEHDVRVTVSVDGTAAAHDRHRRFSDGRGSHRAVRKALAMLAATPDGRTFGGLLCTIDVRNDPIDTYRALVGWRPPAIDFLLPHGNWNDPPLGRAGEADGTPYADWLIRIFEDWYAADRVPVQIRLFQEIMHLALGGDSAAESLGLAPTRVVVIETDGAIEQSDSLKSAYAGAPQTGLHVARNRLDAALGHPGVVHRQSGGAALAAQCRSCEVLRICGGGLYAHRYRAENGFLNPSVYCPDLLRLIRHIGGRLSHDLADRRRRAERRKCRG